MAIDPQTLAAQQRAFMPGPQPKRKLMLVRSNQPVCRCGECRRCRNREAMRLYRAGLGTRTPGPKMLTGRTCAACSGGIADKNESCFCHHCRKSSPAACRAMAKQLFTNGGGI
jgi:hypothetical protein